MIPKNPNDFGDPLTFPLVPPTKFQHMHKMPESNDCSAKKFTEHIHSLQRNPLYFGYSMSFPLSERILHFQLHKCWVAQVAQVSKVGNIIRLI